MLSKTDTKPLSLTEAASQIQGLYNAEYQLASEYTLSTEPIDLIHIPCGTQYTVSRAKQFMREGGSKCPTCFPPIKKRGANLTEEEFLRRFKEQLKDEYTYLAGFVNSKTPIKLRHNDCSHEYEVTPHMLFGVKQRRCPKCANKRRGGHLKIDNYLGKVLDSQSYGKEYKWIDSYSGNNKDLHLISHNVCEGSYKVRPNDFQQGYRCPICYWKESQSKNAEIISTLLNENEYTFNSEEKFENCRNKMLLPFDFYIPDSELLIEYDGEQHFMEKSFNCEDKLLKTRKNDFIKNEFVLNHNNLALIRFNFKNFSKQVFQQFLDSEDPFQYAINLGCLVILEGQIYNKDAYYSIKLRSGKFEFSTI